MSAAATDPTQQYRQLHLPMFLSHEIEAVEQAMLAIEQRKDKAHRRDGATRTFRVREATADAGLFDAIDDRLLDIPLGGLRDGNELNCDVDPLRVNVIEQIEALDGESEEWSDAAIEELHEVVLHYSLRLLQARGNGAEKKEVLQWIFAPTTMVAVLQDEHMQPVEAILPQSATPFSFEQCCRICGYSPERLQDGLVPVLKEIGLGNVFKELFDGKQNTRNPEVQRANDLRVGGST